MTYRVKKALLGIALFILYMFMIMPLLPSILTTVIDIAETFGNFSVPIQECFINQTTNQVQCEQKVVNYNLSSVVSVLLVLAILLAPIFIIIFSIFG